MKSRARLCGTKWIASMRKASTSYPSAFNLRQTSRKSLPSWELEIQQRSQAELVRVVAHPSPLTHPQTPKTRPTGCRPIHGGLQPMTDRCKEMRQLLEQSKGWHSRPSVNVIKGELLIMVTEMSKVHRLLRGSMSLAQTTFQPACSSPRRISPIPAKYSATLLPKFRNPRS